MSMSNIYFFSLIWQLHFPQKHFHFYAKQTWFTLPWDVGNVDIYDGTKYFDFLNCRIKNLTVTTWLIWKTRSLIKISLSNIQLMLFKLSWKIVETNWCKSLSLYVPKLARNVELQLADSDFIEKVHKCSNLRVHLFFNNFVICYIM